MSAHTLGPWFASIDVDLPPQVFARETQQLICATFNEADARLISAAPQLYAFANHPVLEWLLTDGLKHIPEPQRTSAILYLTPARGEALRKAEGPL